MSRVLLVLLSVCMFGLVGCGRGDITVDRDAGTVTVTLSESDVNAAIAAALESQANPLLRDPSVDLQAGLLVITGQHTRRNGSGETVSGSISLAPTVVDNRLSIAVSSLDVDNLPGSDPVVAEFAARAAERINAALQRTARVFEVISIEVTDSAFSFVLQRTE